jgi:hypothetical protein
MVSGQFLFHGMKRQRQQPRLTWNDATTGSATGMTGIAAMRLLVFIWQNFYSDFTNFGDIIGEEYSDLWRIVEY